MRAIKFRGRRPDNGEWVYGFILRYRDKEEKLGIKESDEHGYWVVDSATVGQSTGLIDKNGNEIFEGDIMSDSIDNKGDRYLGVIVWRDDICCFDMFGLHGSESYYLGDSDTDHMMVIGNIHDNPELLKTE